MDGLCDAKGCSGQTYMGWRPLTERVGRKICEQHWRRHRDPQDSFDLFEEFGFRRPEGLPKPVPKRQIVHAHGRFRKCQVCGDPREPGYMYCKTCGKKRKSESNRKRRRRAYQKVRNCSAFARPIAEAVS
ncbi:MAG: hypothetical protein ACYS14_02195 [Planctomycetota bacterium]|jgi:hypothetical protein